ncbi:hypothetical protein PGTUg99_006464 [Puccinia graminis f. sp. tritici]|uniref:Uncharacterized protein n=1 Tax=Puccinia graminis f. sp. tritici TaxID=56615 RepID=A0A5B0S731_PUCGR|nr:hypothetical protein PGTUg99_006464 [Puccinia graminis f. sp. tritici]
MSNLCCSVESPETTAIRTSDLCCLVELPETTAIPSLAILRTSIRLRYSLITFFCINIFTWITPDQTAFSLWAYHLRLKDPVLCSVISLFDPDLNIRIDLIDPDLYIISFFFNYIITTIAPDCYHFITLFFINIITSITPDRTAWSLWVYHLDQSGSNNINTLGASADLLLIK